jgi:hypothetical protein
MDSAQDDASKDSSSAERAVKVATIDRKNGLFVAALVPATCSYPEHTYRQPQSHRCRPLGLALRCPGKPATGLASRTPVSQQLAERSPAEQVDNRGPNEAKANCDRKPVVNLAIW